MKLATPRTAQVSRLVLPGLLLALISGSPAAAQDTAPAKQPPAPPAEELPAPEEVIKRAIEAMGGMEVIDGIKSSHIRGTTSSGQGPMMLEMFAMLPDKMIVRQEFPNAGDMTMGINGEAAWVVAPFVGTRDVPMTQLEDFMKTSTIYRMVPRMAEEFQTISTMDKTLMFGEDTYRLRLTNRKNPKPRDAQGPHYAFFSVATGRIIGLSNPQRGQGLGEVIQLQEWKAFGDLKIFTKIVSTERGMNEKSITIDSIEFNNVDPSIFEVPDQVKKAVEEKRGPNKDATTKPETPPGKGG